MVNNYSCLFIADDGSSRFRSHKSSHILSNLTFSILKLTNKIDCCFRFTCFPLKMVGHTWRFPGFELAEIVHDHVLDTHPLSPVFLFKLLYRRPSGVKPSFSHDEVHHTLFWQWRSSADCTFSGVQLALDILTLFIDYSAQSKESERSGIFVLLVSSSPLVTILLLDIEILRQCVILCFSFLYLSLKFCSS